MGGFVSNMLPRLRIWSIRKEFMTFYFAVANRLMTLRFSCYARCANMILAFRSFF